MKKKILIIDDDLDMCSLLSRFLTKKGFEPEVALNGAKGLARFSEEHFDIVLCDFRLGDRDGKEVLLKIKEAKPETIVIIITGYSDIKTAVDVIKLGAFDYITKPLIPDEVINVIEKALANPSAELNTPTANSKPQKNKKAYVISANKQFLIGQHGETARVYSQIEIVAGTNYSIILYGESGTGKEVIAKTIHETSNRRGRPFIAMDCGTLSKELAGSELFGHVKGAFTGAVTDKEGHFELANGGTLFLDEVANLSPEIQAALLRVIQERKFKRVGGTKEMDVDVRIIVASNENLQEAYKRGKFREDLYHRFNEFSIEIPPLRERREDIMHFANHFLNITNKELEKTVKGFSQDVINALNSYVWYGNLRELRNVVKRAVLLSDGNTVELKSLPFEITNYEKLNELVPTQTVKTNIGSEVSQQRHEQAAPQVSKVGNLDLKSASIDAEYETILAALKQVNFNKSKAAKLMKIDRKTLYNKIKEYQMLNNK